MAKRPPLDAAFAIGVQPILDVPEPTRPATPTPLDDGPGQAIGIGTPKPRTKPSKKDHRANRQPFTVWLDKKLVLQLRQLSRDLVSEHGRMGNSIETLVTEGIEHVLATRKSEDA